MSIFFRVLQGVGWLIWENESSRWVSRVRGLRARGRGEGARARGENGLKVEG